MWGQKKKGKRGKSQHKKEGGGIDLVLNALHVQSSSLPNFCH